MFFYEVAGHIPKLSSFGRGKTIRPKKSLTSFLHAALQLFCANFPFLLLLLTLSFLHQHKRFFDLPMRFEVFTHLEKAFPYDTEISIISNRKFWLNGKCPSNLLCYVLRKDTLPVFSGKIPQSGRQGEGVGRLQEGLNLHPLHTSMDFWITGDKYIMQT